MDKKDNAIRKINILCIAVAAFVVLPLLILGHFDYPSADDWSLGELTFRAVQNGEGIIGVLKQALHSVLLWREKGEPRFSAAFLGTLQPGIWGEHFYRVTPWLMIGSLFFSEILLCTYFFVNGGGQSAGLICGDPLSGAAGHVCPLSGGKFLLVRRGCKLYICFQPVAGAALSVFAAERW
ncbi:MAG: hypothetical protein NC121_20505 [Blautia sp.]|nr:hypothetical protein [Blautia sp.]